MNSHLELHLRGECDGRHYMGASLVTQFIELNCRRELERDGKVEVYLPRRAQPVLIPKSWVTFRKRNIAPQYRNRRNKFPLVLKMPADLAKTIGVIE